MKVALLVAALPAVFGDEPQRNHVPASNAHERIVGGNRALAGAYPWIALVTNTYVNWGDEVYASCGGTLIDPYWVLTAAHCETPVGTQVLIGASNRKKYWEEYPGEHAGPDSHPFTWTPELKTVTHAIPHPWYSNGPHDVMLLKLDSPSSLTPIQWDNWGTPAYADGDMATVMGWGNTEGAHDDDMQTSSMYGDGFSGAYNDGDDVTWHPAQLREVEAEQVAGDDLREERLRRGHGDLRSGVRVEHGVGFARDRRAEGVADRDDLRALLAGVAHGHDELVALDERVHVLDDVRVVDALQQPHLLQALVARLLVHRVDRDLPPKVVLELVLLDCVRRVVRDEAREALDAHRAEICSARRWREAGEMSVTAAARSAAAARSTAAKRAFRQKTS